MASRLQPAAELPMMTQKDMAPIKADNERAPGEVSVLMGAAKGVLTRFQKMGDDRMMPGFERSRRLELFDGLEKVDGCGRSG